MQITPTILNTLTGLKRFPSPLGSVVLSLGSNRISSAYKLRLRLNANASWDNCEFCLKVCSSMTGKSDSYYPNDYGHPGERTGCVHMSARW